MKNRPWVLLYIIPFNFSIDNAILAAKITAAQNEVVLSYHRVCGLYFVAVIFAATIVNKLVADF